MRRESATRAQCGYPQSWLLGVKAIPPPSGGLLDGDCAPDQIGATTCFARGRHLRAGDGDLVKIDGQARTVDRLRRRFQYDRRLVGRSA
jgi:hypothetical protein